MHLHVSWTRQWGLAVFNFLGQWARSIVADHFKRGQRLTAGEGGNADMEIWKNHSGKSRSGKPLWHVVLYITCGEES